jgi:hypothetical protein
MPLNPLAFPPPLTEPDERITTRKMSSIPIGDNPFNHDFSNMGTELVRGVIIMHPGYDAKTPEEGLQYPLGYLILVNTRTGNRVKVVIDESF